MKVSALILSFLLAVTSAEPAPAPETRESVRLPVFMYHRLLKHPNGNDPYTVTPSALEQDLKYLSQNGYTAIGTQELLDYTENGAELPEKPVMLTFDDGFFNNICYAAPLLEQYGMKAIIFAVGTYSQQSTNECDSSPSYSYIQWECMESLPAVFEIQNHTWDMHKLNGGRTGIKRRKGETREQYQEKLTKDLSKLNEMVEKHTGKAPVALALPFGAEDSWAYEAMEAVGIKMCFCSREGISTIKKGDLSSLKLIRRMVRKPGVSAERLLKKHGE